MFSKNTMKTNQKKYKLGILMATGISLSMVGMMSTNVKADASYRDNEYTSSYNVVDNSKNLVLSGL